jgi:hypothetical protein
MKGSRAGLFVIAGGALFICSASIITAAPEKLSAATNAELAEARNATAKYLDVEQAIADGYVNEGYAPGEGFEYVNEGLIDCTFDAEQPEVLHYIPSGNGLRLVGAEYVVPTACTATAPEGFTGDDDEWEGEAEGLPIWALNVWLWLGNPNGVFAEAPHPRIP